MKLSNQMTIDYRSTSVVQLPLQGMSGVEMILPGGSTSCMTSSSCSCGTHTLNK
jgi:hypothetical protein